ncbi:MAG TPA: hypothetical protein VKG26_11380 [Bacteroidia bacterium]|nr:hypothetical protein [Bacteroidia bacterium]
MKTIRNLLCFTVMLFFAACSNGSSTRQRTVNADSLIFQSPGLKEYISLFKNIDLPAQLDTIILYKIDSLDSLKSSFIKTLAAHIFKNPLNEQLPYDLQIFYTIDSVKTAGKYNQYCDSLNIGMTKNAKMYAVGKTKIDSITWLLVWGFSSYSYEACPSTVSFKLYGTLVNKGVIGESFFLAEQTNFSDPPSIAQTLATSIINKDGSIKVDVTNQIGDLDSLSSEYNHQTQEFLIKDGLIKSTASKIDTMKILKPSPLFKDIIEDKK